MKSQVDRKGPLGAGAVEFGRTLPALLVILRGLVQAGLALYDRTLIGSCAYRLGASCHLALHWTPYGAVSPPKLVQ
jgi:hypothetical protein